MIKQKVTDRIQHFTNIIIFKLLNNMHLTQIVQSCKSCLIKKGKKYSSKAMLSLKKQQSPLKKSEMKEKEGNTARERAASWAVGGWERCTLPGTLMNALQASSLPCSLQQCGFHAYANHALWDTVVRPKADERKHVTQSLNQTGYNITKCTPFILALLSSQPLVSSSLSLSGACFFIKKWYTQHQ